MRPAVGVLLAALLAACGLLAPAPPDWVVNRNPLASCGSIADGDPQQRAAQQCMLDAYQEGRGAELVTTSTRPTGYRLTTYVRIHENGTIEMFFDMGMRSNEPGAWERFRCDELIPTSESDPDQQPGEKPSVYTLEDCEQLPVP